MKANLNLTPWQRMPPLFLLFPFPVATAGFPPADGSIPQSRLTDGRYRERHSVVQQTTAYASGAAYCCEYPGSGCFRRRIYLFCNQFHRFSFKLRCVPSPPLVCHLNTPFLLFYLSLLGVSVLLNHNIIGYVNLFLRSPGLLY